MFHRWLTGLSGGCLLVMLVLTLADALGRYFLAMPIQGASEIVGFLLGYTIFLALPTVTREERHIRVGVLVERLPATVRALEWALVYAATVGGMGLVTWLLYDQAARAQRSGVLLAYVDIPRAPFIYPIVVLAGLAALLYLPAAFGRDRTRAAGRAN